MLKVVARMQIAPEAKDRAVAVIENIVSETVQENGCINYNFCKEIESDASYAIIETWESSEALDAHMKSKHFTELIPELSTHVTGDIEISVFEVLL